MIISLSGAPGSGKSTVAQLLAKKLGYKRYYMGGLRREAARRRGLTLEEYNKLGEQDFSTDDEVDRYQESLGRSEDDFVIEGRTSFHFIPHSYKVYLDVDSKEGARRIFAAEQQQEERNETVQATVEETENNLARRVASDRKRYQQYYGFDCYEQQHYDLVIDTTAMTPEQVVDEIIEQVKKHKSI